jgi:hypothetical protein
MPTHKQWNLSNHILYPGMGGAFGRSRMRLYWIVLDGILDFVIEFGRDFFNAVFYHCFMKESTLLSEPFNVKV